MTRVSTWRRSLGRKTNRRARAAAGTTALGAILAVLLTLVTPMTPAHATPCNPCTLFNGASPGVGPDSEATSVELGVRFVPKSNGSIIGVRFWKDATNTGTHTGYLYDTTTGASTSAVYTNETASGWQEADFASPVAVTAGHAYIASYLAPNGHYTDTQNYFANELDTEQLTAPAPTPAAGNGVYRYGSGGVMPSDSWNASNYWVDPVFKPAPDTTPPTVTSTSPTSGATGVSTVPTLNAVFSKDVQPSTITWAVTNTSTGTAVAGSPSYSSSTTTASFAPAAALATSTQYSVALSGATDASGNVMAPVTWSFTTAATPTSTITASVFTGNETVNTPDDDNSSVELGMRFHAAQNGYIKAIKFYKDAKNVGPFSVSLWNTSGNRLAGVDNVTLTGTGWQTVNLPSPVAITAATDYIASYHTASGYYAYNSNYFTAASAGNTYLTAPAATSSAPNGVYTYSSAATYPASGYQNTNYWVDVLFSTDGTDTTPPTITQQLPAPGATGVSASVQPQVTFSKPVQPSTVNLTLTQAGAAVAGTVQYDNASQPTTAVFKPNAALAYNTTYTVSAGPVKDLAGNSLAATSWTFTTGPQPAAATCAGTGSGPILVLTSGANPFTCYYGEILKAEGLNDYNMADISTVTATQLANCTTVILGDTDIPASLVSTLTTWVNGGGNLITMRPRANLSPLTGLLLNTGVLSDQYMQVNATTPEGAGIYATTPMQFHGTADQWTVTPLSNTTTIAELYNRSGNNNPADTGAPAVTIRSVGAGQVASFTYDLARSIVYMRQGNPAQASEETDGVAGLRPSDLFYPNWIDLNLVSVPQADEQQRLLSNIIETVNRNTAPVPKFWYLPGKPGTSAAPDIMKAVLVSTGDQHATGPNGLTDRITQYNANSPAACSNSATKAAAIASWDCLRFTMYLWNQGVEATNAPPATVQNWTQQGYEVARHVALNDDCLNIAPNTPQATILSTLNQAFTQSINDFESAYAPMSPTTNRIHCMGWPDWFSVPQVSLSFGIRLDTDYYYMPNGWTNTYGSPQMQNSPGFFTGSGFPMRFANTDGSTIDVYQATTQMNDEFYQAYPDTFNALVTNATNANGFYGAFVINNHLDQSYANHDPSYTVTQTQIQNEVLAAAVAQNVPIVTAQQLLQWTDARNNATISGLKGTVGATSSTDTFTVTANATATAANITTMLPTAGPNGQVLSGITNGGKAVTFSKQTIKGLEYALFTGTGAFTATYTTPASTTTPTATTSAYTPHAAVAPGAAPTVSSLTALPAQVGGKAKTGTATVTWKTDNPSSSQVLLGTKKDKLAPAATVADTAGDHELTVAGLKPDTTYYLRAVSTDPAGRTTFSPSNDQPPLSFHTPKADRKAPELSNVAAVPYPDGSVDVTWTTDKPSLGTVLVGPNKTQMHTAGSEDTPTTTHHVVVDGLTPGQSYVISVQATDIAQNTGTWSGQKDGTARVDMPKYGVAEHSGPTFMTGARTGGAVVDRTDGTLTLQAASHQDFADGTGSGPWGQVTVSPNGSTKVTDGALTLDGSAAGSGDVPVDQHQLTFSATFDGAAWQSAGWGDPLAWPSASFVWHDGALHAVTTGTGGVGAPAKTRTDTTIDGNYGGAPHVYSITRNGDDVRFFVDGKQVADAKAPGLPNLPMAARDTVTDNVPLRIQFVQAGGMQTDGGYTSQILDSGQKVTWLQANWQADTPAGTGVKVWVRTGSTTTPDDGTWGQWQQLSDSGATVGTAGRYLQYRVDLTGDGTSVPVFHGIGFQTSGQPQFIPGVSEIGTGGQVVK